MFLKNLSEVTKMDNQQKRFCPNCGEAVESDARFCTKCGTALAVAEAPKQEEPVAEPVVEAQQPYNYYQAEPQQKQVSKRNSIMSMIFGLVALESSVMGIIPIYAFIFMPLAIVFSILGMRKSGVYTTEAGAPNAFSRIGKITAIIALPLAIVFGLIGMILTIGLLAE